MSKAVKKLQKEIDEISVQISELSVYRRHLEDKLIEAKSRQLFWLNDGPKIAYGKLTLVQCWWTEKGLGYSDDCDHFDCYAIVYDDRIVKFDKNEALYRKMGFPYRIEERYGNKYVMARMDRDLERQFGAVVKYNSGDRTQVKLSDGKMAYINNLQSIWVNR